MNFTKSMSYEGLRAATVNIPSTGLYNIQGTITTPSVESPAVSQGPGGGTGTGVGGAPKVPSQIIVTISINASPVFVTQQGAKGFDLVAVSCSAGDVLTITPSSSLVSDQQPNAVRLTIAVSEGPK